MAFDGTHHDARHEGDSEILSDDLIWGLLESLMLAVIAGTMWRQFNNVYTDTYYIKLFYNQFTKGLFVFMSNSSMNI